MERTLSVRHTAVVKFALPPIWIAIVAYGTCQLWLNPDVLAFHGDTGAADLLLRGLLVGLIVASLVVLFAFVVPLKRVRLGPDGLRVSNYRREVTIPFAAIARVRQNWLPTFRVITLELRREVGPTRRVIFMPRGRPRLAFWRAADRHEDELVDELRRLAGLTP